MLEDLEHRLLIAADVVDRGDSEERWHVVGIRLEHVREDQLCPLRITELVGEELSELQRKRKRLLARSGLAQHLETTLQELCELGPASAPGEEPLEGRDADLMVRRLAEDPVVNLNRLAVITELLLDDHSQLLEGADLLCALDVLDPALEDVADVGPAADPTEQRLELLHHGAVVRPGAEHVVIDVDALVEAVEVIDQETREVVPKLMALLVIGGDEHPPPERLCEAVVVRQSHQDLEILLPGVVILLVQLEELLDVLLHLRHVPLTGGDIRRLAPERRGLAGCDENSCVAGERVVEHLEVPRITTGRDQQRQRLWMLRVLDQHRRERLQCCPRIVDVVQEDPRRRQAKRRAAALLLTGPVDRRGHEVDRPAEQRSVLGQRDRPLERHQGLGVAEQ